MFAEVGEKKKIKMAAAIIQLMPYLSCAYTYKGESFRYGHYINFFISVLY